MTDHYEDVLLLYPYTNVESTLCLSEPIKLRLKGDALFTVCEIVHAYIKEDANKCRLRCICLCVFVFILVCVFNCLYFY